MRAAIDLTWPRKVDVTVVAVSRDAAYKAIRKRAIGMLVSDHQKSAEGEVRKAYNVGIAKLELRDGPG